MPEVEIRPAIATDIKTLITLEHSCETDYVWQVDVRRETGHAEAFFREVRLPRSVPVIYPRTTDSMVDEWNKSGMLVAVMGGELAGYVRISDQMVPGTAWITDVVVARRFRRKGIGTMLVISAQQWAGQRGNKRMVIEMQSKNHPCIRLAQKLGYEFCGYNDQYYATRDVALFFGKML
jgi:ribosomal protein S18 acetylase RimI-like enzyme